MSLAAARSRITHSGLWFHDDQERSQVAALVQGIVDGCKQLEGGMVAAAAPEPMPQAVALTVSTASMASDLLAALRSGGGGGGGDEHQSSAADFTERAGGNSSAVGSSVNTAPHHQTGGAIPLLASAAVGGSMAHTAQQPAAVGAAAVGHTAAMAAAAGGGPAESTQVAALTRQQLQETLMELLRDDRFIDMLHAQYMARVRARSRAT